jgi:hypothetical protein
MNVQEKLYWMNYLQTTASQIGLGGKVKQEHPTGDTVGAISWVYDDGNGIETLGWSVEQAEQRLRQIARQ